MEKLRNLINEHYQNNKYNAVKSASCLFYKNQFSDEEWAEYQKAYYVCGAAYDMMYFILDDHFVNVRPNLIYVLIHRAKEFFMDSVSKKLNNEYKCIKEMNIGADTPAYRRFQSGLLQAKQCLNALPNSDWVEELRKSLEIKV